MNNFIVSELVNVSNLSDSIVSDIDALDSIDRSAYMIGWKAADMKMTVEKEDHKTE